jgi:Mn2+/Fe2+ NRAMP family transporter
VPHFAFTSAYIGGALALLGTTLTAYAYVWETIEVAEERPKLGRIGLVQVDAALGIVVAGLSFWFILIATGATLGVHHHPVETAEDAARALVPVAGKYAGLVFAIGLLGSALVAIPVIAGTSAYVAAEMFRWRITLDDDFEQGKPFYFTLGGAVALSAGIGLLGVPPIKLLFLSGIAGGIATPFTLILMLLVGRDAKVMHKRPISPWLAAGGWLVAATVTAATLVYFWQNLSGGGN